MGSRSISWEGACWNFSTVKRQGMALTFAGGEGSESMSPQEDTAWDGAGDS